MHRHNNLFDSTTEHIHQQFKELGADLQQEKMEEQTCWRTNLFIDSEVNRVDERNQTFKKRTSFEENLVNDHLVVMKQAIEVTGLKINSGCLPSNDKLFQHTKQSKQIEAIDDNTYLSQQQKWQTKEVLLNNQQNFSIFMRLTTLLEENKQELVYLLAKIIHYTTTAIKCATHSRKKANIVQLIESHKANIIDSILRQQTIKVTCPLFFSNENEQPFLHILYVWLYNVLSIKNGVYEQQQAIEEEQNFFD